MTSRMMALSMMIVITGCCASGNKMTTGQTETEKNQQPKDISGTGGLVEHRVAENREALISSCIGRLQKAASALDNHKDDAAVTDAQGTIREVIWTLQSMRTDTP